MALTDVEIQALRHREKKYKVFDGDGLYLLVHPRGWKFWYMKYHIAARPHEVSFGAYPAVPLKLARERRDEARQQLARGLNPTLEKKIAREARSVVFAGVAEEWLGMMATPVQNGSGAPKAGLDPETQRKHRWLVDTYLNPPLGKWPIAQITAQTLQPSLNSLRGLRTAERIKMSSPYIFPLSHQSVVVLYDLKKGAEEKARFMFPVLGSKEGVMSENTLSKALRTLGYTSDVMTWHGFRSMASTLLNEQQCWHPDAIERQLAHAPRNKVRAAYNYAEHLPERRRMMQAWADLLDELREAARKRKAKRARDRTLPTTEAPASAC